MTSLIISLLYRVNGAGWQIKQFEKNTITVGRAIECDLPILDTSISRRHFRIERVEDNYFLTDLGSSNGTQVDEKPLAPRSQFLLDLEQVFQAGNYEFKLVNLLIDSEKSTPELEDDQGWDTQRITPAPNDPNLLFTFKYRNSGKSEDWISQYLSTGDWILGRSEDCSIQINSTFLSRHHAQITIKNENIEVTDLGSKNGLFIINQKIEANKATVIQFGESFFINPFELCVEKKIQGGNSDITLLVPSLTIPIIDDTPLGETAIGFATGEKTHATIQPFALGSLEKITIGRGKDNNIVLDHPLVSRYHVAIEKVGARFRIKNLKSTNGVYVNNILLLDFEWLQIGDVIKIGPYVFSMRANRMDIAKREGHSISAEHLNKHVTKKINLLKDISLSINSCEFVAVVGTSGAGKTTLVDAINGFRPATSGKVLIDNTDLYSNYDLFRTEIGYVPQKDIVHLELTPESALNYAAQLRLPSDVDSEERSELVTQTLKTLGLYERKGLPISMLSGGQIKRVSIGVELLSKPQLFFLDEPTSGLDPSTEYDMMKLLRRLADQGRTIIIITHATKNIMMCDKVAVMARGGYLAFFGQPDQALKFFDPYRTNLERREKEIEFDDIYRILDNPSAGTPEQWQSRYSDWKVNLEEAGSLSNKSYTPTSEFGPSVLPLSKSSNKRKLPSFKQFLILSKRNLRILWQDKMSLGLMLFLAPILGSMNFIWGKDLFDPVHGNAVKIMSMWFMVAIVAILSGAMSSVREIVKENDIYRRERAIGVGIAPYIFSKIWIGVVLSLYQGAILLFSIIYFVNPTLPSASSIFFLFVTISLGILVGYILGLSISAISPNQNFAMIALIVVIVPQFLFAGVLLPLDNIPFGNQISMGIPTRWVFESFVNISGMGKPIIDDVCWTGYTKSQRNQLTQEQKDTKCTCMGKNLFISCRLFPGILSENYYDKAAKNALALLEPKKPERPDTLATPEPLPTPTLLPKPTSIPMPRLPLDQVERALAIQADYFHEQLQYLDAYQMEIGDQSKQFGDIEKSRLEEYSNSVKEQFSTYADRMSNYGDELADWQKKKQKAIGGAETILSTVYDEYGRAFVGTFTTRWINLSIIVITLILITLISQWRKEFSTR